MMKLFSVALLIAAFAATATVTAQPAADPDPDPVIITGQLIQFTRQFFSANSKRTEYPSSAISFINKTEEAKPNEIREKSLIKK